MNLFFLLKKNIFINSKVKIIISEYSNEKSDIDVNKKLNVIYDKPITSLLVDKNDLWLFKIFVESKILNPYAGSPEVEIFVNDTYVTPQQGVSDFDEIDLNFKEINRIGIEHMNLTNWNYFKDLQIIIKNV